MVRLTTNPGSGVRNPSPAPNQINELVCFAKSLARGNTRVTPFAAATHLRWDMLCLQCRNRDHTGRYYPTALDLEDRTRFRVNSVPPELITEDDDVVFLESAED